MPISYQEQAQLSCPTCGSDLVASIWLILDAQEEPAAIDALLRGELNLVRCSNCESSGPAGSPLLYHDGQARRVIFAAAPGSAEHEIRDQARDLHSLLVHSIPEEQRRPYLADVDITQDLEGLAKMIRRITKRRSAQATHAEVPPIAAPPSAEPPLAAGDSSPLLEAVQLLLAANSPEDLEQIFAANPVLLAPTTDATLAQLANVAMEQRAYEIADSLQRARQLLGEMGGAVAPAASISPEPQASRLPELIQQALLQAQSGQDLLALSEQYPLLLQPEADSWLAAWIEQTLDEGDERLAQALEERREALAELRALRATAAAPVEESQVYASGSLLEEALEALLITEGEAALPDVVKRYPVLLDDVAAKALEEFALEAQASGDEEMAAYALSCQKWLARMRPGR